MQRLLILTSTLPASDSDSVPGFVKDQAIWLKKLHSSLKISILAPHNSPSQTQHFTTHPHYDEYRFHYFLSGRETLAGHGILPTLQKNPLNYLLIPFLFVAELFATLRLIRATKPSVIYAHWFTPQAIVASLAGAITNTPFVYTTHAADVAVLHKIPLLGPWLVKTCSLRARRITAVSGRSMAKLEAFFMGQDLKKIRAKSSVIPMGVDLNQFSSARLGREKLKQEYDLKNKQVFLFVGRLAEKKGVSYLLQAFAEFQRGHKNTFLIIAGSGTLKESLERQAKKLNITSCVRFTGHVSGQIKNDYFHLADVVVLPSIITADGDAEGLPVVLMEGLAAGKICIASDVSGADAIIKDGQSGFIVRSSRSDDLRAAFEKVLALSETNKKALQVQAKKAAQQFNWPEIAEQHYQFLFSRGKR